MKVIDAVSYNGEKELFDLRYNILKEYVDEFVVVESPHTFSGREKPLYFKEIEKKYEKVKYYIVDEDDPELWEMAKNSPNTVGAEHWKREFVQKESIKKALTHLNEGDIVYIGDCDEIYSPECVLSFSHRYFDFVAKLKLRVYTYYLNNLSSEEFYGTIVGHWKDLKDKILNHVRSSEHKKMGVYNGWHFTSLKDGLRQKLLDSYTEETYANEVVMTYLDQRIENNTDFLGRSFKFEKDESAWPKYLKENREKYLHLLRS